MSLLDTLFRRKVVLDADARTRLAAWQALVEPTHDRPVEEGRMLVVDVESTGLDVQRDRLIAIGAVAVVGGRVDLGDSFYVILKQAEASSRDNILIHGIGGTAQRAGAEPVAALLAFLEFAGKAPLVGFHASFDAIMIERAVRRFLGVPWHRPWLDLAYLAPALHAGKAGNRTPLDDWLDRYGIDVYKRHDALADALATAQLLQVLAHRAAAQGKTTVKSLYDIAADARWLHQSVR